MLCPSGARPAVEWGGSMGVLNLESFRATPLKAEPYEHLVVRDFVKPEALPRINADFPKVEHSGSFPFDALTYGPEFRSFVDALQSAEFRSAFEEKFHLDLRDRPHTITVRRYCGEHDGNIHTDSVSKIITILIYLNPSWDQPGGRLRLLRAGTSLDDFAEEVPPSGGTLNAFRRSDRSWHGHLPSSGERRVIQFNWVTTQRSRQLVMLRHRFSAQVKRVKSLFARGTQTPPEESAGM
jgi:SM-20-related protein